MASNTVQLRVTLPSELQAYLQTKANRFGLNMSAYVKNLIINDVRDVHYPVFKASDEVEKAYNEAKEAEKSGELIPVDNLDEFFKQL
ncbi:MAG: hypothetical protein COY81_04480 [Candidatus Pacebacteria bacterium CG_4_10_14_0_8_um_filter_43_12]|uniref:Uncharacterized protein n=1 Tax=Candidatus Roizmanbacteria bacterium CG_4_10_14_0_2_um_filter_39_13 TaxID=1974825 RepID=A0A2M7TYX6_9BACT|nr:MAG: hypothetical protein COU66_00500 [Candidatus Pacebacteria bacterium CG10_big_fil_rev_8_21_14_0_10_44_11]PIY79142.1 MAG: hypothetical protein COY81_04480 [Candidatus Pacebacteria bacterium CG_4_10_14_0_8_um_filter_43_12]PIZ63031.1 MAG: hypothetical protein COY16_02915 [Candidatus Roizmanbacteria bacterium CG_4_10_14_0_2_um_filter_39_13]